MSKKRRRGKRKPAKGRSGSRGQSNRVRADDDQFRASAVVDPFAGDLWDSLRQGARNVAGVRYQLAVTAHLLVEARNGVLPFVEIVPEGFEDIDCLDNESLRWLVQVKEAGAGAGSFTASSVAEALSHAIPAAPGPTRIVLITDAQFGRQVSETGWDKSIAETAGYDVESTIAALDRRGHDRYEAEELLTRSHIVRLPWNTTPATATSIASCYSLNPTSASIVADHLLADLSAVAADQRSTSIDQPLRRDLNDLDALVERVVSAIDVDGLESAVRTGLCEIANFSEAPSSNLQEFLLGVDAVPSHIGANYDVIRPGPTRAAQVGLENGRYVLLAGPSGSGKSAQMWRSARDMSPGARVIRVNRIETDDEVTELLRYVRLLGPSTHGQVVVCCDDLGRPATARWPILARRLLEVPAVALLGAVRHEDFTAELLRYGGELVALDLDDSTAIAIAEQLSHAGVPLALEVAEAVQAADGQLMEYVALLTSGKRMRSVLAAQAQSLLESGDASAADVARLVCTAHVLGVSLEASTMPSVLSLDRAALSQALARLRDEHVVTSEGGQAWRGLHQRRSDVLLDLLHETPPPTLSATIALVTQAVHPRALGWALRRLVELFPDLPSEQTVAVEQAVAACSTAVELATLLESLERADNSVSANAYLPVLERDRREGVAPLAWAMLVCGDKLGGVRFGGEGSSMLDRLGQHIQKCANNLPERSVAYCSAATSACEDRLVDLSVAAPLEDAVRLLEAAAPYVTLAPVDLAALASKFAWPRGVLDPRIRRLYSRLLNAAFIASSGGNDFSDAFGSVSDRLERAARSMPDVVAASITGGESLQASIVLLAHPAGLPESPRFAWDLQPRKEQKNDVHNLAAVELATTAGECCPELELVEVITVLADGERLRIGDFEPGYKRLAGNARPARHLVRINVGIQAAISRQVAACSWTELVRARTEVATALAELTQEAPRRLASNDISRRRSEWVSSLGKVDRLLAALPRPPAASELDIGSAPASWDRSREEDDLSAALGSIASMLRMLVPEKGGSLVYAGASGKARDAAAQLAAAIDRADALTTAEEQAAYVELEGSLGLVAALLASLGFDNAVATKIKGSPDAFAANLDLIVEEAKAAQLSAERTELERAFECISGVQVIEVVDDAPFITSIAGHQWVVLVSPESWESVAALAAELPDRIVDVPVSVVCRSDEVLLPIAARLSTMVSTGLLPVGGDFVERIASALGRDTIAGPSLKTVSDVASELTLASWENSRHVMRGKKEWPVPDDGAARHLAEASRLVDSAGAELQNVLEPMRVLLERVAGELDGDNNAPVAAELAGSDLLDASDVGLDHAMAHVTDAVVRALDLELERATGGAAAE